MGSDNSARVLILEATGPAFSAGHDLSEMPDREPVFYEELVEQCCVGTSKGSYVWYAICGGLCGANVGEPLTIDCWDAEPFPCWDTPALGECVYWRGDEAMDECCVEQEMPGWWGYVFGSHDCIY